MFSLQQTGGRLPKNGRYSEYPFADTMHYACAAVFLLDSNSKERRVDMFDADPKKLVYLTPIKRERENSGRMQLKAGQTYIIVASTEAASTLGEFFLSIYFSIELRDVEVKRVFAKGDKNDQKEGILPKFIPEEAEKLISRVPSWKI